MKNFFEKIIKRDDGSQVKIEVQLWTDSSWRKNLEYDISVYTKAKGKRKWIPVPINPNEKLSNEALEVISNDELLQAKIEFWESIKPQPL